MRGGSGENLWTADGDVDNSPPSRVLPIVPQLRTPIRRETPPDDQQPGQDLAAAAVEPDDELLPFDELAVDFSLFFDSLFFESPPFDSPDFSPPDEPESLVEPLSPDGAATVLPAPARLSVR